MITLYEKTETNFTHNGICALDGHIINPVVFEELNGLYTLEFDYPLRAPHAAKIVPERLVKCPVPNMDDQLFRITYHKKELSGITHFTAYHVFYDLVDNFIEDTFVVNKSGQGAVVQLLGATQYPHPFTASSNIPTIENARIVRHNPVEVLLGDMANGFLSRWGGEIIRDNFHFYMQLVRGSDNGVAIRDKKNLTGYDADVDFQTVCTRIMPQGFDGLFLPEKYVDSPRINQYIKPKIRVIKYDSVKAAEGQYADDEDAVPLHQALITLRSLAAREYSVNRVDLPMASYSVTFAPLADTEEYKNFAVLETVKMGDTVTVVHEEDGFEITARIIGYKYNPLTKAYISVALGNYTPKFTDIARDIKRIESGVNHAEAQANYALQSANGKNTNFYGPATPANPRPGDLWFKENGDKLELWVYETRNGVTQWYPLLTDLTQEEMKKDLAEAAAQVEEAKQKAEEAAEAGEAARIAGEEAKAAAEEAKIAGEEALAAGQEALTAGEDAKAVGQAAQAAADQAVIEAQEAVTKANQAFNNATTAMNDASTAASQAAVANTTAGNAYNKSVKSTAVDYAVGTSGVTAPTSGWQTTVPATNAGQFLWTRTVITLQDNSAVTSYSVTKHGDLGPTGNGITSTAITYQAGVSGTTAPTGTWTTTIPSVSASQYLWTRTIITYSDSTTSTSYSVGMMGEKGDTGAAGTPGFPLSVQELNPAQTGASQKININYTGTYKIIARGAAGLASDSRNRPSNVGYVGGKGAEISAEFNLAAGDILTVIVGKMGTRTDPVTAPIDGTGGPGGGGTFVLRNIDTITDPRYQFTKDGQDFEVLLVAAGGGGTTDLNYSTAPLNGTHGIGATWYSLDNYIAPNATTFNGITATSQATGGSIQQYITFNAIGGYYTRGSCIAKGGYGGGAVADDTRSSGGGWFCNTTTAHSWSCGMKTVGSTGENEGNGSILIAPVGLKGDAGTSAPAITAVREQYYLSTSNSTQTGDSWSDTVPVWSTGKFYWTRVVSVYSDGAILYSTPVLAVGLNSSLVTALEAKTTAETLQTTVTQHATSISLNATNITNLTGRMTTAESTLTVQAGQIAAKASQTDLNTLTGRVTTAESTLTVQAGQIAAKASQTDLNTLTGRVTTAESTLTVQAGQIALKANQTTVDTLTGRVTAAESSIVQNADYFSLSLAKHTKGIADLAGASIAQVPWQQGSLSTANGTESASTAYVRSGWFDVIAGKKYLIQTYEGVSPYALYGTATLIYYKADKTFLSYTTNTTSTTPFTAPVNAVYLRIRYSTTLAPETINCYLLQTETTGGYVNLEMLTNVVKLQATTDTMLITVTETKGLVGTQHKINVWDRGTINDTTGLDADSASILRSNGYINVQPNEKYIAQTLAGGSVTMTYHYYGNTAAYSGVVPTGVTQVVETTTAGAYTNTTVIPYLTGKNVESMTITGAVTLNPATTTGDFLAIYRIPLAGNPAPSQIQWSGMRDTANSAVFIYSNGVWTNIGTVSATTVSTHSWNLNDTIRMGLTGVTDLHIAFFCIKGTGARAGINNGSTTPFTRNLSAGLPYPISILSTSASITVPANVMRMRVRVSSTVAPDAYTGNVYPGTVRVDYSKGETLYSALLMQRDLINLRVAKNDVVNQINISTEGILIAGNKIRITGQTTIDNAVIQTAMIANLAVATAKIADLAVSTAKIADLAVSTAKIANLAVSTAQIANAAITEAKIGNLAVNTAQIADAAITNAKIANLDAAKINTGTLSADRIAAGSITSAKLTVANGFITNAMIADATIASAKIAALDAGKITTGTLAAARIAANSITADKLATDAIQVGLAGWTNTIRITPTAINWYNGSTLGGTIGQYGTHYYFGTKDVGSIGVEVIHNPGGTNNAGLQFTIESGGDFAQWYCANLGGYALRGLMTFDPRGVRNPGKPGIHMAQNIYMWGNLYMQGYNIIP